MQDCLFCKIVKREIPADIVYEDDQVLAFNDINPQAPTHILIIPKQHIATLNDIEEHDQALVGKLPRVAARLAEEHGFAEAGYRVVMNCNDQGGQTVYHIHMHLMGGRRFTWPAG
ncbi:histidine triad nucleotide-binding protein [Halomonas sp. MCCC 1A17488]|uniref:Histidine triad nucleotide-binding protein n=1 Tax=Billgrantia sulfidoxydans TaxID=2733484 RepID=A0ABX7W2J8_9GAMM|nr:MULTISPECIES: histidine triad nucleotide-binding protein [Halomonas]MCE8016316.1 histidine triad nucleotide-binding protein [Halomonas sp. MCCC 1A17488]MCG3239649.1 histidine triad nucleotide-binding protein [Halomonas sp. MCCC 1A17488]QPP50439.1 histidine triad nucleotide-binding protein [Halomonas sp. SS10-MC5]QTP54056.1 histidine triad nucleotide-binding protein [Halomonas sulfidoxydans]